MLPKTFIQTGLIWTTLQKTAQQHFFIHDFTASPAVVLRYACCKIYKDLRSGLFIVVCMLFFPECKNTVGYTSNNGWKKDHNTDRKSFLSCYVKQRFVLTPFLTKTSSLKWFKLILLYLSVSGTLSYRSFSLGKNPSLLFSLLPSIWYKSYTFNRVESGPLHYIHIFCHPYTPTKPSMTSFG